MNWSLTDPHDGQTELIDFSEEDIAWDIGGKSFGIYRYEINGTNITRLAARLHVYVCVHMYKVYRNILTNFGS